MKYSSSKLEEWESDSSEVAKLSRLTLHPELGKESVLNKWLFQPLSRPIDSLINPIFFLNYQIKFKIQWKDSTLILRDPFYVSLCLNSKAFNKSHHCFYSCVIMWNLLRGVYKSPSPPFYFILDEFFDCLSFDWICDFTRHKLSIYHNVYASYANLYDWLFPTSAQFRGNKIRIGGWLIGTHICKLSSNPFQS